MRLCSVDGCERKHVARGYCFKHYQAARRSGFGHPVQAQARKRPATKFCAVDGCGLKANAGGTRCTHHALLAAPIPEHLSDEALAPQFGALVAEAIRAFTIDSSYAADIAASARKLQARRERALARQRAAQGRQ